MNNIQNLQKFNISKICILIILKDLMIYNYRRYLISALKLATAAW